MEDKIVAPIYIKYQGKIRDELSKRNDSKLAHGDKPVSEEDFRKMKEVISGFINECLKQLKIVNDFKQLPDSIKINIK